MKNRLLCRTVLGPWSMGVQSKKFQKGPLNRSRSLIDRSAPCRLRMTAGQELAHRVLVARVPVVVPDRDAPQEAPVGNQHVPARRRLAASDWIVFVATGP